MWLTAVLALCAAPLFAADAEPPKDDAKKVFVVDDISSVTIRTEKGAISVKGTDRLTVQVERTGDADSRMCAVTMGADDAAKTLRLEVKKRAAFGSLDCMTGFRVDVPRRLNVRAAAKRGDIEVAGVEGDVAADAGTGDISLKDLRGEVKAHAGTGEVRLEWTKAPQKGKSSVTTGTGNATAFFPAGSKIKTDLKSGTGTSVNEVGDSPDADFTLSMASGGGSMSVLKAGQPNPSGGKQ